MVNDFEASLKRHIPKDVDGIGRGPKELYQAVAFYASDAIDELQPLPKMSQFLLKKHLKDKKFVFPFYSEEVFLTENDVKTFLPMFVKQLIEKKFIPKDVVLPDNSVDQSKLELAFVKLNIALLERDLKEFRDENLQ